jgi:ribose/xylose/arabinose/galactoside ABC-type transport system permease subunit
MASLFIGIMMLNCFKNGLLIVNLDAYWQVVSNGGLLIIALIVEFIREKRKVAKLRAGKAENQPLSA